MAIDKIIVDETTGVEAAQIINETIDLAESNVQSVVAGTNVTVDNTDPNNPIVNLDVSSGTSGTSGVDGTNGTDGTSGVDGTNGTDGTSGVDGTNGTDGTSGVDGTNGTNGTSGVDGTNGTSGVDGTDGTGIEGSQYILVTADGTDIQNAAELQAAYDQAKTLTPSATNRITVIAAPGNYNFEANEFIMDTQFIDLVSLDGNRSVVFNSTDANGKINVTANDVFIKGLDMQTKSFTIANNLSLLRVENCIAGTNSFGGENIIASGTFIDCVAGSNSFAGLFQPATGIFINCEGEGNRCFGGLAPSTGIFTNCRGIGSQHFSAFQEASGTYTNCLGEGTSFAIGGTASGTFTNCIGGNMSFAGDGGTLTGKLIRCQLTTGTFETPTGTGKIILGIDGNDDVINLTA